MPKRSNAFQRIITLLNASLAGQASVTESEMLTDNVTKESREVDVVIRARAANYDVVIGVEVVSWGRVAGTPWIEQMRAKHANLGIDKLILVSQSGFSKSAEIKAEFYGIETLTVERAAEKDWTKVFSRESTGIFQLTNLQYECSAVCAFEDGEKELLPVPLGSKIETEKEPQTVNKFVYEIINRPEFRQAIYPFVKAEGREEDFWFSYHHPGGLWKIDMGGRKGQVIELRVGLRVLSTKTPMEVSTGRYTDRPFVAGLSNSDASTMQFVLVEKDDGSVEGALAHEGAVKRLSSFKLNR